MSHTTLLRNFLECQQLHSDDGQIVERSKASVLPQEDDFLNYHQIPTLLPHLRENLWSMCESLHQSKETIWNDRKLIYFSNSPDTSVSRTLGLESTSNDVDYYPFWNEQRKENYQKLWCPRRTDCVVLDSNSLNSFCPSSIRNSWFSTKKIKPQNKNSQTTF